MKASIRVLGILGVLMLILSLPAACSYRASGLDGRTIAYAWIGGAGALGLLSGYTTGNSNQPGTASEFLKFLSGGVLVPLVGGIVAVVQQPHKTTETTTYTGDHVTQQVTETTFSSPSAHLYPLGLLAGFFIAYSMFAIVGVLLGVENRARGSEIKMV